MQNIDVRFTAATDFAKARADIAGLEAQVAKLNETMMAGALGTGGKTAPALDAGRWLNAAKAVESASSTYRNAASSSGLFTTQQIRATAETEKFTKALQAQKLSFGDMRKNWGIMQNVFRDQQKMQRMTAQFWGTDSQGRSVTDITMPKNTTNELNSWRRTMGNFGNMAASAGTQVVNLGKNIQWSGRQLTVGFTYPMALFGAAAGVMAYKIENAFGAINKVYDFSAAAQKNEAQMTKEQGDLRVKSLQTASMAAKEYGSTVENTLRVEQELAATGLKGTNLQHTTGETMRISALGDIDPKTTENMIVSLQTAFRKTIPDAKTLTSTLNYMNAASNATSLSLQDIAESVPRAAGAFASLGGDAKQMTVLLVAMREAGVQAAQGANAIKSASARILNPAIVDKVTGIFKGFGNNINVQSLVNKSGGNFFDFIKLLGEAENKAADDGKKLSDRQKATANAAMFGTYQFSRLTSALTNVADAYGGVNNQTSKAIALMHESPKQLASMAEVSRKAMMDNPAGQLREAWAQLQIQIGKMGEPFLTAASDILGAFTKIIKVFNSLPNSIKHITMIGAGVAALAGPAIMITGLMLNMIGQITKGVGAMAKMVGISKLYTVEQKAAELTTAAQNEQLKALAANTESNIELTDTFAREVAVLGEALSQALEQVNMALSGNAGAVEASMTAAQQAESDLTAAVIENETQQQSAIEATIAAYQERLDAQISAAQQLAGQGKYVALGAEPIPAMTAGKVPPVLVTGFRGEQRAVTDVEGQARAQASQDAMLAGLNQERAARVGIVNQENAQAAIQEKVAGKVNATSASTAIMGASMVAMIAPTSQVTKNIAEWAMIGTIAVPAIKYAYVGMAAFASQIGKVAVAAKAAMFATTAAMGETVVAAGGLRAGIAAAGAGALELVNPLVLAGVAIGAAALGLYMWQKHQDAIVQNQVKAQDSLSNMADDWASAMGKVETHYKGIHDYSTQIAKEGGVSPDQFHKDLTYYQGKGSLGAQTLGSLSPTARDTAAMNTYVGLIIKYGLTAKQAQTNITALLIASGEDYYTASANAKRYGDELGNMKGRTLDWGAAIVVAGKRLRDIKGDGDNALATVQEWTTATGQFAHTFAAAFANNKTSQSMRALFDQLNTVAHDGWARLYRQAKQFGSARDLFAQQGITNAQQFRSYENTPGHAQLPVIEPLVEQQRQYEAELAKAVATSLHLSGNISTIKELQHTLVVEANQWNYSRAVSETRKLTGEITNGPLKAIMAVVDPKFSGKSSAEQLKEMLSNLPTDKLEEVTRDLFIIADSQGITRGKNAWQTYNNILNDVTGKLGDVKKGIDGVPDQKTIALNITTADIPGILKTAMSGVESDMSNSADARLQAAQTATSNQMSQQQQAQSNRLQWAQQAQSNALDKRFQRRQDAINKSYTKRENAIKHEIAQEQKADQIRQQLFQKEKDRLDQLAQLQNTNIDFNQAVNEGRLQDAAKTLNTSAAQQSANELDNELAASQRTNQARIDSLNKKVDHLEKQKDNELKSLSALEDREKTHLQKVQQLRQQALQKQQAAETAALQASQDAEKANLDAKLALFQTYVATNQKDLQAWMKKVGLTYDDFGVDITNKGETWANSFQVALQQHIRAAGMQVASDNMWAGIGKSMASQLLQGIGFPSKGSFTTFVKNGVLPKNFGEVHHGGGVVGQGSTGTSHGGAGERMVLAEDGERIIDKNASKKYSRILDAIHDRRLDPSAHGGFSFKDNPGGVPSLPMYNSFAPAAGYVAGATADLYESGIGQALRTYIKKVEHSQSKVGQIGHHAAPNGLSGYVPGPGGRHRPIVGYPVTNGLHDIGVGGPSWSAVDLAAPVGRPVYAVGNGRVTSSYDIRGYEPRREMYGVTGPSVQDGYRSYGRVMQIHLDAGPDVLYAHLSKRGLDAGATVKGGSRIGLSGNTGNVMSSSGNGGHLHFASDISPYAFLRRGGKLKWDNTMVMAHKGETMLSAPITKKFEDQVANGGCDHYDVTIDMRGAVIRDEIDFKAGVKDALNEIKSEHGGSNVVKSKVGLRN